MKSDDVLINNRIFRNELKSKGLGNNSFISSSINDSICSMKSEPKNENFVAPKFKRNQSAVKLSNVRNDSDKQILDLSDMKISPEIMLQSNNLNEGIINISQDNIDKPNLKLFD